MQPQLHTAEAIEHSTETYLWTISTRSQAIYVTILVAVLAALISLPFITIEVAVQSGGIIRPVAEKHELKPLIGGMISQVLVKENQYVANGQVIMQLQTQVLDSKLELNARQQTEKKRYTQDLSTLVRLDTTSMLGVTGLQSPLYRQQYSQFVYRMSEHLNTLRKKRKDLAVTRYLYREQVVARLEYEDKEYELSNLQATYLSAIEQQLSQWQADLNTHTITLTELLSQAEQLRQEKELYTLRAPVSGTLQQLAGKYAGSYLQAGESIGVISPDSNLIAECYVSPSDIGQLQRGMKATFQIDAFDYNEWGLVSGKVTDIAHDFVLINNQPTFKITCRLDRTFLQLKSGYRGTLKKGMTLRGRFSLTERSLYHLLYDKADDWLNPLQEGK